MSAEAQIATFEPAPTSGRQVRQLVTGLVQNWGLDYLADEATLCAGELVSNAILHTRAPFTLTVRPAGKGVRIDVLDNCPDQLPVRVPSEGSASDLTITGTTGRGLQIVAALASRWGISTTDNGKTVWVELTGKDAVGSAHPELTLYHQVGRGSHAVEVHYLSLPVRPAVASGIQVDDLVREIQMYGWDAKRPPDIDMSRLFDLLDRSAPVRLEGRHVALRAAAGDQRRFDLHLSASKESFRAVGALGRFLADLSGRLGIPVAAIDRDVADFRRWLSDETARQWSGDQPSVCPLDT